MIPKRIYSFLVSELRLSCNWEIAAKFLKLIDQQYVIKVI